MASQGPGDEGRSEAEQAVQEAAQHEGPVLLVGEPGTGKGSLAWRIHRQSARAQGPFVPVRCAEVPESLLEAELFGALKGSFTGRSVQLDGAFEQARGGTLFFDGIDALPPAMQAKLLRVFLEEKFVPVGDSRLRPFEGRLICSSALDLQPEVEGGRFRADLASRLAACALRLAPVRERAGGLPSRLASLRAVALGRELRGLWGEGQEPELSPEAVAAAGRARWPENLRELEAAVLVALASAEPGQPVGPELLCPRANAAQKRERLGRALDHALKLQRRSRPEACDEAEAFVGQAEGELAAFKKARHRIWNASGASKPMAYPRLDEAPAALAAAVALLLRLDRMEEKPRWPLLLAEGVFSRFFPHELAVLGPSRPAPLRGGGAQD